MPVLVYLVNYGNSQKLIVVSPNNLNHWQRYTESILNFSTSRLIDLVSTGVSLTQVLPSHLW